MLKQITPTGKKNPYLKKFRRHMRANPTPAESALAKLLHKAREKFSRQTVFVDSTTGEKYIADFWLWERQVVLEVDGPYHRDRVDADAIRDASFAKAGVKTVRVSNSDVMAITDLLKIFNLLLTQ